jgi:GNAT superfamily N-acetyltransferase
MVGIRPFRPGDEEALYEVCLRTGDDGQDATALYDDPRLLGAVFVGPYLRFSPELAWVYADEADVARAYVLGVADTRAFESLLEASWWPQLRARHPLDALPANPHDREVVELIHAPVRRPDALVAAYPAHLHIDLAPEVQGGGRGGAMLRTLLGALVAAGAPGVHLGVARRNERAIGFYEHLGFAPSEAGSTRDELVMVRTL